MRDQHAPYERIRLIPDDDVSGLRDRLQPCGKVRFRADDRVIHAVATAEIPDVAEAGIDAHAYAERVFDGLHYATWRLVRRCDAACRAPCACRPWRLLPRRWSRDPRRKLAWRRQRTCRWSRRSAR